MEFEVIQDGFRVILRAKGQPTKLLKIWYCEYFDEIKTNKEEAYKVKAMLESREECAKT